MNKSYKVVLMLLLIGGPIYGQTILSQTIQLQKESYSAEELIRELQDNHGLSIGYGRLPDKEKIDFENTTVTVKEALDQLINGSNFTYQLLKNKVLIVDKASQIGKATISGYIRDLATGEALIGATVYDKVSGGGVISNNYGFYSLTLPKGPIELQVAYLGFENQVLTSELNQNLTSDFELKEEAGILDEVSVVAEKYESAELTPQTSTISLTSKQIENVPMILGEQDVLKAIQLLPGIQAGTEGSSGIYVRGGGADQNLILMDGVPVYNTAHVFGAFSIFNSDAVNQIDVIKGGFPARYGGRLSSVIDISMREGNNKKFSGSGSVGLISSKFTIEGPIRNENTSFILSGRRTYLDLLAIPFDVTDEDNFYFYDFNAKINHRFSTKDRVFISFYGGNDVYENRREYYSFQTQRTEVTDSGLDWGNLIGVIRWTHVFSAKLFGTFSTTYSQFEFNTLDERFAATTGNVESLKYASGVVDYAAKADFEWIPQPEVSVRFGASTIVHHFNTGVINFSTVSTTTQSDRELIKANEYAGYLENDFEIGRLRINLGAHASLFRVDDVSYSSIQPRVSGRYLVGEGWSLKASYSEMRQFLHLLTNSGVGLPTDLWVPATSNVEPQFSRQTAVGISKGWGGFELSLESYYKEMENLIEYQNGASYIATNTGWEEKIESGDGRSYGTELLIRKNTGRLTGWIGYTLSKSTRQFDNLNFGRPFDYKYDRRHDISITSSYELSKGITLASNWVYGTGSALTIPLSRYVNPVIPEGLGPNQLQNFWHNFFINQVTDYAQRNNFRMRNYHRLDVSISWKKQKKRGVRTWAIGVYNLYNRQNPFFVYVDGSSGNYAENNPPTLKQFSLLPALPFVNYSIKF